MSANLLATIQRLRRERNAVILCHTYQPPVIQDLADFVGDSYGLSKEAAGTKADVIIFCGVRFMAETAAVLNPDRTVILPDLNAGCPMADMVTAEQLRALKAKHPGAPVVCYVNSTAEVKAESTICCTSSNAAKIVASLGDVPEVLFIPDQFLGRFVEKKLKRKLILWEGFCPTHTMIRKETILRMRQEHPEAKLMVHPECVPEVQELADYVLSTGQMCDLVKTTDVREFIIGTEEGILHTLRKIAPHIAFVHLSPFMRCLNMKKITVEKIAQSLATLEPRIVVAPDIAVQARRAIEAMIAVTETRGGN